MKKQLYLIAIRSVAEPIAYAQKLRSGSGPQVKYYADIYLRELPEDFRRSHRFYVIACETAVSTGDPVDSTKMEACFRLI